MPIQFESKHNKILLILLFCPNRNSHSQPNCSLPLAPWHMFGRSDKKLCLLLPFCLLGIIKTKCNGKVFLLFGDKPINTYSYNNITISSMCFFPFFSRMGNEPKKKRSIKKNHIQFMWISIIPMNSSERKSLYISLALAILYDWGIILLNTVWKQSSIF